MDVIKQVEWSVLHEVMNRTWQVLNGGTPMPPTFPQEVIDNLSDNIRILYFDLLRLYEVANGVKGATGATGATGAKGDPGVSNIPGPPGAKGDKGDTGPTIFRIATSFLLGNILSSDIFGQIKVDERGIQSLNGWSVLQNRIKNIENWTLQISGWLNNPDSREQKLLLAKSNIGLLAKTNTALMVKTGLAPVLKRTQKHLMAKINMGLLAKNNISVLAKII